MLCLAFFYHPQAELGLSHMWPERGKNEFRLSINELRLSINIFNDIMKYIFGYQKILLNEGYPKFDFRIS